MTRKPAVCVLERYFGEIAKFEANGLITRTWRE